MTPDTGPLAIKKKRRRRGVVVSNRMQKTIVVRYVGLTRHLLYGKVIRKAVKFKVHDEKGVAGLGDLVEIEPTRPISKEKCFRLVKVLKKSQLQ